MISTRLLKECPNILSTTLWFCRSCILLAVWPSTGWLQLLTWMYCFCQVYLLETISQFFLHRVRIRWIARSQGWGWRMREWRRWYWSEPRRIKWRTWHREIKLRVWHSMWCKQKSSCSLVLSSLNLLSNKWSNRFLSFDRRLCRSESKQGINLLSMFGRFLSSRKIRFYDYAKVLETPF